MLSPDLVRARRVGSRLLLSPLSENDRTRAINLARLFLEQAKNLLNQTREQWEEALKPLLFLSAKEKRVALALIKLIEDQTGFELADFKVAPEILRQELFTKVAIARKAGVGFTSATREQIIAEVASHYDLNPNWVEQHLYSDLKGAQRLTELPVHSAEQLVSLYEQSQAQAVLLRAVRVIVEIKCSSSKAYRNFFRKMKFLRLLATIKPTASGTYRIEIDGPFSLFEATTKYGLQLALILPSLYQCQHFQLTADIRWGKTRIPLQFQLESDHELPSIITQEPQAQDPAEEITVFLKRFESLSSQWQVSTATDLLELPGIGICIPDLQFTHPKTGEIIYFELLGYWSREAVWRRIEFIQKGFPYKILFAVSKRLRVSEQALDQDLPGMLYVFNDALNAKIILDHLNKLSSRT